MLLDPASRKAIATDGEAIALTDLPDGFDTARLVHKDTADLTPTAGEQTDIAYDLDALRTTPAYRVAFNPAKLAALAAAIGAEDLVVIEFAAHPEEGPMKVTGKLPSSSYGYLMPQPMPDQGAEGLLENLKSQISNLKSAKPEAAPLPPPVVIAVAQRGTLEIAFGGVPAKEIREALKSPDISFNYSGRGTRKGVPANTWYGPDNPYTREKITTLLAVEVKAAA